MTIKHLRKVLQHLHRVLDPAGEGGLTDGQLLARFIATRDEEAFAALVRRHGPMVLGVCRRILRHTQDAEDAFQAAFLVLARKAASVANRQAVGSWLYRVAYRIAVDAKARNDKRRVREKQVDELPHPQILPAEARDWQTWLDHELSHLPEIYRVLIVACDLEGQSRKEAARLLGLAKGTVSSRLARGRRLLAKRLSRYGLSLSSGFLAAALSQEASAALPFALTSATVLAASGQTVVSVSVGLLTKGALQAMLLTKLKWAVGAVMVAAALGATGLAYRAAEQTTPSLAEKKPLSEVEKLRRENELLKLNLEIVLEKVRAQKAELRSLRGVAKDAGKAEIERVKKAMIELENKLTMARSDEFMWQALWSERMSRPGRTFVTVSQAEADAARHRTSALTLRSLEAQLRQLCVRTQLPFQEVAAALKALREARDPEVRRRGADDLAKALKKLREQMGKQEGGSGRPVK